MAYTKAQLANIDAIIRVGRQLGASDRDIQIALATAKQESSFNNINYGDKAGPDSRGLFQQRNNWGSLADRMNPEKAARMFYLGGKDGSPGLLKIKNRNNMTIGAAAYAVQHFSKQYQSRYDTAGGEASSLLKSRAGISVSSPAPKATALPKAAKTPVTDSGVQSAQDEIAQYNASLGAGTAAGVGAATTPQLSDGELASRYGYAISFMRADPEVYGLFKQAVAGQWTAEKFAGAFRETAFYRTHGEAYRQAYEQQLDDPATFAQNTRKQKASIGDAAAALGVRLDNATLDKLTNDSLFQGWTDADLKNHLALMVQAVGNTGHYGGQAGDLESDLRKTAAAYGQAISDPTLMSTIRNITSGASTINDYKAIAQKRAEDMFPGYGDQLKQGMTLRDIADPYIESMAQTLELDPANIQLNDPSVQYALMAKGAKGPDGKEQSFSMYDFQRRLRADPRWSKTKQAQDATSAAATKVLSDFGFFADGG